MAYVVPVETGVSCWMIHSQHLRRRHKPKLVRCDVLWISVLSFYSLQVSLVFKPDVFSRLSLHKNNPYGIKTTLFVLDL